MSYGAILGAGGFVGHVSYMEAPLRGLLDSGKVGSLEGGALRLQGRLKVATFGVGVPLC